MTSIENPPPHRLSPLLLRLPPSRRSRDVSLGVVESFHFFGPPFLRLQPKFLSEDDRKPPFPLECRLPKASRKDLARISFFRLLFQRSPKVFCGKFLPKRPPLLFPFLYTWPMQPYFPPLPPLFTQIFSRPPKVSQYVPAESISPPCSKYLSFR